MQLQVTLVVGIPIEGIKQVDFHKVEPVRLVTEIKRSPLVVSLHV